MTALIAMSIFAGLGLLLIVGALRADMRERRQRQDSLIEEIRAEAERVKKVNNHPVKKVNLWRKS